MTLSRSTLSRVLKMDRRELWDRVASGGQREASRVAYLVRRPKWRREKLSDALDGAHPGLAAVRSALARKDWSAAHQALMRHVVAAPPRFALVPADRASRVETIRSRFPKATEAAIARADDLRQGRFDLLGYLGLRFGAEGAGAPDWHLDPVHQRRAPGGFWAQVPYLAPESGDHKIIWELNRHQSWMALGRAYWLSSDARYRDTFVSHFRSWMTANPPLSGVNWASMLELGLRSLSWLWALQFFAAADGDAADDREPWTVDLLLGLDRQLRLVERNLSWHFSPNTHLLGEALALYIVGRCLPELRRAGHWERLGGTVLLDQIKQQIHHDGGHAELSTHYHRYTLDFYELAFIVARRTDDTRAEAFGSAVAALARFARTMADDCGRLPTIGDDDGGSLFPISGRPPYDASDSLQLAAQLLNQRELAVGAPAEEVVWLTGAAPADTAPSAWPSHALRESGYYVSRTSRGDHLTIDAGQHGFLNGGHAHADALAIALTIQRQPFLIDPGTGCYTIDVALRDRFRSTPFHNTLTIDGRPQSVPAGPFHWRSTAQGAALEWRTAADFDLFEGAHDGYRPLTHHRTVLSRPGCWYFVDRVVGAGARRAELHWHIHPDWDVAITDRCAVRAVHNETVPVWIVTLDGSSELFKGHSELGWHSPVYGQVRPTTCVRSARDTGTPLTVVTAIVECDDEPVVTRTPVLDERGAVSEEGVAFIVDTPRWREVVMFTRWASQPDQRKLETLWTAAGLTTDARVVCWRESADAGGRPVVLVDGDIVHNERGVAPDQRATGNSPAKEHERSCAG